MNSKLYKRRRLSSGFTLVELGVVLAIIGVLASIAVPSVSYFLRQGRVKNVTGSINSIRNWVGSLQASGAVGGALPVTEGGKPPTVGTALNAQTAVELAQAARLDHILVSAGITDKLMTFGMGTQMSMAEGEGAELMWNTARRAFYLGSSTSPSDSERAGRDWSNCSRLESRLTDPTVVPSSAEGANFRLDGVSNLPANSVVSYVVLKDVPFKDAVELAKSMNGEALTQAATNGTADQDGGPVVFKQPQAGTATVDVFVYVAAL